MIPNPSAKRLPSRAHFGGKIGAITIGDGKINYVSWRDCEPAKEVPEEGPEIRFNTRENFDDIFEFAESLRSGVRDAARGYMGENGKIQLTDGERRWRGVKILSANSLEVPLPVILEPKGYSKLDRTLDLLRMNNGKALGMLEQARAMQRALTQGADRKKLHKMAGCSATHVDNCLALLETSPKVQEAVATGEMSASLAVDLSRQVKSHALQDATVEKARENAKESSSKSSKRKPTSTRPAKTKIKAKHLPIETGKKAQAKKKQHKLEARTSAAPGLQLGPDFAKDGKGKSPAPRRDIPPATSGIRIPSNAGEGALKKLQELADAIPDRSDCREPIRYEVLEYLLRYLSGKETVTTMTKFILGII